MKIYRMITEMSNTTFLIHITFFNCCKSKFSQLLLESIAITITNFNFDFLDVILSALLTLEWNTNVVFKVISFFSQMCGIQLIGNTFICVTPYQECRPVPCGRPQMTKIFRTI